MVTENCLEIVVICCVCDVRPIFRANDLLIVEL